MNAAQHARPIPPAAPVTSAVLPWRPVFIADLIGNFIGTDWTGTVAVPTGGGIAVPGSSFPPPGKTFCASGCDGAPDNRIGGPDPSQRNVIATHFEGFAYLPLDLHSSGNTVQGNFIGTDATGDHALIPPGASSVIIIGDHNQVGGLTGVTRGGSCTGPCNVITEGGLLLAGSNNTVQGNRIGTDATGTKSLGESNRAVAIQPYERRDEPCNKAVDNRVGGTEPGAGNLIAGSDTDGVFISGYLSAGVVPVTCGPLPTGNRVEGNLIGTDVTGTKTTDGTGRSFGNARGVIEDSGSGDVIGGPIAAARNVISGNAGVGVLIVDNVLCGCGNVVQGNLIGTDITGTKDLGNGFDGIDAGDANSGALRDTVIADNVVSGNGSRGLFVANGSSLRVVGNKIGTNATGTAAIPNDADGVEWLSPGPASSGGDGAIGGPTAGERNVVSGNQGHGIVIDPFAGSVSILNNFVGTDVTGTARLANGGDGVQISSGHQLGAPGAGNVISGNGGRGVRVYPSGSGSTAIQANKIGVTKDGAATLGNAGSGIVIEGATDVHVGGTGAGEGNVIAGNGGDGVAVGFGAFPNPILGNSIFRNGDQNDDLGIDLIGYLDDGVTYNDPGDGDTGANMQQNFPVITSAVGNAVSGTLNSAAGRTFRIEVFSNSGVAPCDSSGNGEGETFVGTTNVTTDASSNQSFTVTLAVPLPSGAAVTATATDPDGNTSEFSQCATARGVNKIVVRKQTRPAGSAQSFAFTPSYGSGFSLKDGEVNTSGTLEPGNYSVGEAATPGWETTSGCSDGSPVTAINLSAGETVVCTFVNTQRGLARVVKTVNGRPPSGSESFCFELRSGASTSSAGTTLESSCAQAGNGGVLAFATKLAPGTTYALCETVMPGWTTTLGSPFYVVYNPSGDNSTGCSDFTVQPGETKTFSIDNTQPAGGGLGRTIGFWKNWASCAQSNGKRKPVLDQTLASAQPGGITIGTLTLHGSSTTPTNAPDCLKAVRLLDKSTIDTAKKMASDPAFGLAAQLLAAKLNVVAGAATCTASANAVTNGQALLAAVHFNGITHDKLSAAQATSANSLAATLDKYNNNQLC